MQTPSDVLIVGGGLGAVSTARSLRNMGYEGRLRLVSNERELPYDRPPLSKDFLLGSTGEEEIRLLPPDAYAELGIELSLGRAAIGLDPRARVVVLDDGEELTYERLVVATGARPQRIPALDPLEGVFYLRSAHDARSLRRALSDTTPRVAVVGGGFIGLEVAAVARTLGCEVTVVEALEAPLASVIGRQLGNWIREWHEEHGVKFHCGAGARAALGFDRLEGLVLDDGQRLSADVAVVGVGIAPNLDWLHATAVRMHRGVVCDAEGRTSDPSIVAVGDVVCQHVGAVCHSPEHWTATSEQALRVAGALLDSYEKAAPLSRYFWSDQFGARLQFDGDVGEHAQITIESGSVGNRAFVACCHSGSAVTGVFAMNSPREFARSRLTLTTGRARDPASLSC